MAYVILGIVGIFYAMLLEAIAKKFSKYVSLIISVILFAGAIYNDWTNSPLVNIANASCYIVWFCSVSIAIFVVRRYPVKRFKSEYIVMFVGLVSWAGATQVSRFLGYIMGV